MADTITAHISDLQGSALAVAIDASGHHLIGDEPIEQGGANKGPTPFDLLNSALGACSAMTIRWYAERKGWPLNHVNVEIDYRKTMRAGEPAPTSHFTKHIDIVGPLLTPEQRAKLLDVAERCPVHQVLTGKIEIETVAMNR
ncbi:MAG: OsmC family protein [Tsuneonella suprasediminis]|nr:OsmC family protein [Altererythrobacter sp. N1]